MELKSSKIVLGEFLEFKGKQEDTLALKQIKRSKVDRISIQQTSMLGFGNFLFSLDFKTNFIIFFYLLLCFFTFLKSGFFLMFFFSSKNSCLQLRRGCRFVIRIGTTEVKGDQDQSRRK